ncbi:hypothetical protein M405DRAFT_378898 [Rhizopogon salebrosus TDB-379]|nr:hypothetical protein M405DRAFT_378898 [Rhizopogon salebrosus TDB-379]
MGPHRCHLLQTITHHAYQIPPKLGGFQVHSISKPLQRYLLSLTLLEVILMMISLIILHIRDTSSESRAVSRSQLGYEPGGLRSDCAFVPRFHVVLCSDPQKPSPSFSESVPPENIALLAAALNDASLKGSGTICYIRFPCSVVFVDKGSLPVEITTHVPPRSLICRCSLDIMTLLQRGNLASSDLQGVTDSHSFSTSSTLASRTT